MEKVFRDVVKSARIWAKAREKCRRLVDSKSAKPAAVEKAKHELSKASARLARDVASMESFLRSNSGKRKNGIDWHLALGTASAVAQAVSASMKAKKTFPMGVIDTTGEEV